MTGYSREPAGSSEGGFHHIGTSMTAAGAVLTRSYGSHCKQRQPSPLKLLIQHAAVHEAFPLLSRGRWTHHVCNAGDHLSHGGVPPCPRFPSVCSNKCRTFMHCLSAEKHRGYREGPSCIAEGGSNQPE